MQTSDALVRRLATVPGMGAISSGAFAAMTPDVNAVRTGCNLFVGQTVDRTVF